jgi:hypothetical protein
MATRTLRVAMEGVTGRLGTNQHLIRAVLAIRNEGGLPLRSGDRLIPEPVLVGRNPDKLSALAVAHGGLEWSSDRAATLADKTVDIYFDVAATGGRLERTLQAKRHEDGRDDADPRSPPDRADPVAAIGHPMMARERRQPEQRNGSKPERNADLRLQPYRPGRYHRFEAVLPKWGSSHGWRGRFLRTSGLAGVEGCWDSI